MKILILGIMMFASSFVFAQERVKNLDGDVFIGTLTENTPPDVDRRPVILYDTIKFINGKIFSDALYDYQKEEINYTAFIDDRRMIAFEVVVFQGSAPGTRDGQEVNYIFSGSIIGGENMTGLMTIVYSDGRETTFYINAKKI
ncbi:MAG TPA: hypothetical protein PKA90_03045 [Ignavibacteria bacterium]|nr:hypothetical protein [Ignavibacteria bacterium]HMR39386.1 hypothetical protein [Ignavibacteria bacterium]